MQCPLCNAELMIADRQGIEIDHCPRCRGVWLDRGELDKILERSATLQVQGHRNEYAEHRPYQGPPVHHGDPHAYHGRRQHKRKSFLEEIFDFD